jgi:hypothetical protein
MIRRYWWIKLEWFSAKILRATILSNLSIHTWYIISFPAILNEEVLREACEYQLDLTIKHPDHKYAGTELLRRLWELVKSSTSAMESSVKTVLQTFSQDPNLLEEVKQTLSAPVLENERILLRHCELRTASPFTQEALGYLPMSNKNSVFRPTA